MSPCWELQLQRQVLRQMWPLMVLFVPVMMLPKAYWSKMIFSGKAVPPKELANDAAVKAHVKANPDAVGYIDAASVDGSIKVLLRVP